MSLLLIFGQVKAEKIEVEDTGGHFQCGKYLDKMDQNTKIFKFTFFKKGSMNDFNSNCNHSENSFSNTYNWQFGGEIFFLLSAFQEGCVWGYWVGMGPHSSNQRFLW